MHFIKPIEHRVLDKQLWYCGSCNNIILIGKTYSLICNKCKAGIAWYKTKEVKKWA